MQGPPGARVLPSCAHSTSGSFPEVLYVRGPRPKFPTTYWDLFSELRLGSGERAPSWEGRPHTGHFQWVLERSLNSWV